MDNAAACEELLLREAGLAGLLSPSPSRRLANGRGAELYAGKGTQELLRGAAFDEATAAPAATPAPAPVLAATPAPQRREAAAVSTPSARAWWTASAAT